MPLARIITNSADDSLELSMQLRSRGFRVETVAPDHVPDSPADVEVRLEECAPEDVLTRATVVKENEDLWVFIAPGALDERVRPMRMVPPIPPEVHTREEAAPAIDVKEAIAPPRVEAEDDPILPELAAPRLTTSTPQSEVQGGSGNGSTAKAAGVVLPTAKDVPVPAVSTPRVAVSTETKPRIAIQPPTSRTAERAKVVALPRPVEVPQIPKVSERVAPKLLAASSVQNVAATPARTYKITFQTGPAFWRRACAATALVVLAVLVAMIVALQPTLPAIRRPAAANRQPMFFSTAESAGPANRTAEQVPANQRTKATIPTRTQPPRPGATAQTAETTQRARRRRSAHDDVIAEDTVVFYDRGPVARRPKPPSQIGVKRYSDEN